ncbi:hypothetical protein DL95DRAFT_472356 [Leptodontidium sp. 2 PMI_412]|nr:hypothetical protein DL95DRAFT_472356 [Leptodontidium sp. 2 PMI_412]
MAPFKRDQSVTLVKSPLGSLIRLIRKRFRQKTLESFALPLLPLRLTKPTFTSTPITFNSSQVDESEFEEETRARLSSESESKEESEESEEEEEDDITRANEYLDQDLKELGLDRLDREDID